VVLYLAYVGRTLIEMSLIEAIRLEKIEDLMH
jgi:hypothetical protein